MKDKRIGVLMGGRSSEREISLRSGKGIAAALRSRGYDVQDLDWTEDNNLATLVLDAKVDVVFNGLHGTYGEDGAVQGLLECLGVPYTGSRVTASAVAMDKVLSKQLFKSLDIPSARWTVVDDISKPDLPGFRLPWVVKPSLEGSSVGVTIVRRQEELKEALTSASTCRGAVMIEEFIAGSEICTSIVREWVLGSGEIVPSTEFYDYEAKYQRNDTQYIFPPKVDPVLLDRLEDLALRCHQALGCAGYSRVDFRVRGSEIYVLEVNTLPGMTETSLLPKAASLSGMDFGDVCEAILSAAFDA